jgi:hypothetical protein
VRWRLEGDLAAHAANIRFSPAFQVATRPSWPMKPVERTRTYAVMRLSSTWPWEERGDFVRSILVFVWLVEGKPTRVMPVVANTEDGPSQDVRGIAVCELAEHERRGRPVVLLMQEGKWRTADRWFPNEQVDAAYVRLFFEPEFDLAAAIAGVKPGALWTRLRRMPLPYMVADGGFDRGIAAAMAAGSNYHRSDYSLSPIRAAVNGGYRDVVRELLALPAAERERTRGSRVATEQAVGLGHLKLACDLLGEKPEGELLREVLRLALEQGDVAVASELLNRGGERIVRSLRPEDFGVVLQLGELALIERLLEARMPLNDERPFLRAAASGRAEVVQRLLDAGARVDRTAPDGTSAMLVAAAQGDISVLELLRRAGANPSLPDKRGQTPLGVATRKGNQAAVEFLTSLGARPEQGALRPPGRDPKLRWIADVLRGETGPVFPESAVTQPPVVKSAPRFEVMRKVGGGPVAVSGSMFSVDPRTGDVTEYPVVRSSSSNTPVVGTNHWAVGTMIVEVDGTVSHAQVVAAVSEEFWLNVDKVIDRYEFEPGEVDGRKVRTRVTIPVLVPD